MIVDSTIHWIYPNTQYDNIGQAIAATSPTKPPGINIFPSSTVLILKGSDVAFPSGGSNQ